MIEEKQKIKKKNQQIHYLQTINIIRKEMKLKITLLIN